MHWTCPLCGSRHYMRVVLSRGRDAFESQFFTCFGCSMVFVEPQLFAQAADVKALFPPLESGMAHLISNERLAIERRFWEARAKRQKSWGNPTDDEIRQLWLRGRLG